MDNLVAEHPGLVSKMNIVYSFKNRPMNELKVHRRSDDFFLSMLLESRSSGGPSVQSLPAELCFFFFFPLLLTSPCWFWLSPSLLPPPPFLLLFIARADAGLQEWINVLLLIDLLSGKQAYAPIGTEEGGGGSGPWVSWEGGGIL